LPLVTSILNRNEVPLALKFDLAQAALEPSDLSEAMAVLTAAADEANSFLAAPVSRPTRVSTLVDRGEDVLVARWPANSSTEGGAPVLLWDDATSETVVFRFDANQIRSPTALAQLVETLMHWDSHRLGSAELWVRSLVGPGRVLTGYGVRGVNAIPLQFELGPQVTFAGFISGNMGYLGISFMSRSVEFPSELKGIDERFPPLRERVQYWTTAKLIAQSHPARSRGYQRDAVLVHELVKREDLTVPAFQDLLSRGVGNWSSMANDVLPEPVRAAIEAHRVGKFAEAIYLYMDHHPPSPAISYQTDRILSALSSEPEIDLEERAIQYLGNRTAVRGSLEYLQIRGKTSQARDAVASFDPDGQWGMERIAVLAAIDGRIHDRR